MKKIITLFLLTTLSCSQLNQWDSSLPDSSRPEGHAGSPGSGGGNSGGIWGSGSDGVSPNTDPLLDRIGNDPFAKYYQQTFNRDYGQKFNTKESGRPGGLCARYVDKYLVDMGCMKSRVHANAKDMPRGLRAKGFKDLGSLDVCNAQVGDVIVYGGTGYGHIEIKTPRGYLSDYLVDIPRPYGIPDSAVTNRREFAMGYGRPSKSHCGSGQNTYRPVIAILRPPTGCVI